MNKHQSEVEKLRMKLNLDGLNLKTSRQPATLGKEKGDFLKSLPARTVQSTMKKPGCRALLNHSGLWTESLHLKSRETNTIL